MSKIKFSEEMCKEFPSEVIKICMNTLETKFLQNQADNETITVSNFLSHCYIHKGMADDFYHKCIEIVINSLATSINKTKIDCFKTFTFENFTGIIPPDEFNLRAQYCNGITWPPKLKLRIEDIDKLLNNLEYRNIVKVSCEMNEAKLN